ncbi:ATP synthase subunit b' [uncultured Alphaproteobacteria bacterium]|uniref:ATP synthase subunit b n=1 Tax=uncultured Alphaproteobacteria bacterium TaxID=91750 RepID=A0A212JV45_9PROT|nr:ATP synthase subunit b' [uncultured Alphaproteobacteria bacterium]
MPHFDATTFASQLFWLAVTFVALLVLMSKIALPRISDILEERQRRISDDLDMAERLKAETEAAIATYEKALAEARASAQAEIGRAMDANAAEAAARHAEMDAVLAAKITESEERIHAARREALAEVNGIAAEVAAAIVGRIASVETDADAIAPVVADIAKERGL